MTLQMTELSRFTTMTTLFSISRGLLVEHHGTNLRNEMAHGLLDDGQFHSEAAIYLWGLSLRLHMLRLRTDDAVAADESVPAEGATAGAGE